MGVDHLHHHNESGKVFKLSIIWAIFAFCTVMLATPDATARGGHASGQHVGSGSHAGHSRHIGGHRHFKGGHRHSGGHMHFRGGHRRFGGAHKHFGGGHRRFGSGHRHLGGGHRRYFGGYRGYYGGYGGGYSYAYPPGYYSPRPYSYSYSYPSYSLNRPEYFSSPPYIGDYNYSRSYSGRRNTHSYNSASTRYPDTTAGSYSTNDLGWRLLAQSNPREALNVFATQAGRHQNDGIPKVGYALSAAMQGDLNKAAWAMRRAFRIDPDSLHYLKIDASLRTSIDTLLAEYHHQLNYAQGNRQFDVAFMIAALNYLIHEKKAARAAIEESMGKLGDNSQSTQNLHRLVVNGEY